MGWFPGIAACGLGQLGVALGCGLALCPSRDLGALALLSPPQSPIGEGANSDRWAVGGSFHDLVLGLGSFCVCRPPRPPAHCWCSAEMQARSPDSSGETRSAGAGSRLRACQTTALRSFSWRKERGVGWGALSANCPALEDSLRPAWGCRCPWPCVEPWLMGLLPPARPLQAPGGRLSSVCGFCVCRGEMHAV